MARTQARRPGRNGGRSTGDNRGGQKRGTPLWPWLLAIGSLVLVVVAVVVGTQASDTGDAPISKAEDGSAEQGEADDPQFDLDRREKGDVTAMGDVDAPVVMVEYSDYRCPYCAVISRDTMPKIIEKYIDTGQVRYEWRDFPIFGDESELAAVAGRAAGEQDKFWEFNEAIYEAAPERSHIDLPKKRLIEFAEDVGVDDIDRFVDDLDDPDLKQKVQQDAEEAQSLGASSTPTFVIGNTPLIGAQPYEEFEKVIEQELQKAEQE